MPSPIGSFLSSCQVCGGRLSEAGNAIFPARERLGLVLSAPESSFAPDSVFFRTLPAQLAMLRIILRVGFVTC